MENGSENVKCFFGGKDGHYICTRMKGPGADPRIAREILSHLGLGTSRDPSAAEYVASSHQEKWKENK